MIALDRELSAGAAVDGGGFGALRLLAGPRGGTAEAWGQHRERLGGPISEVLRGTAPGNLLGAIGGSGLRGRGGAGFPAATKLAAALKRGVSGVVVVGNGSETEPAAGKDDLLLRLRPHLVLDGLETVAVATRAERSFLVVPSQAAWRSVTAALVDRPRHGPHGPKVELVLGPRNFVGGEETALVSWLEGGPARPRYQRQRLVERGWRGRPTLVQNVETLAHLGLVARFGPEWFRSRGTADEPGTMMVSLSGAVGRPGVYEVPIGIRISALLEAAGAEPAAPALLVGGYFGSWLLPAQIATAELSRRALAPLHASPGAGVLHLLAPGACGLREAHLVVDWMARQSADQCGPCRLGLPALAGAMGELARPWAGGREVSDRILRWSGQIVGRGACRHPDGVVNLVRSTLLAFADELEQHRRGHCGGGAPSTLPLPEPG
ncbi:MAG TPA: NADH-ubiquinone oxidoreductase-F iron-sulfur binding region domain-containing protein [Candidatus Nanopelagicaceae bacterium]|nr:NADH-ubiquinone oxidoreductase-F iron-sulfur binding region domain-containing protein [Candidatus Nanopelagicaceae bacterium]